MCNASADRWCSSVFHWFLPVLVSKGDNLKAFFFVASCRTAGVSL